MARFGYPYTGRAGTCSRRWYFVASRCSTEPEVDRFARDPRTVLRRFEERVEREQGVELLIGYEVEFIASRFRHGGEADRLPIRFVDDGGVETIRVLTYSREASRRSKMPIYPSGHSIRKHRACLKSHHLPRLPRTRSTT